MRKLFFDWEGQPRWFIWCIVFLLVLILRYIVRTAQAEGQRKAQEAVARYQKGLQDLEEAKRLLNNSQFLEAGLRAASSTEKLAGTQEYGDAQRLRAEARQKLIDARKKQAGQLLREAEKAYQRPGFWGGGLSFLRPVYVSACQIPRETPVYKQSLQLLDRSAKRAFKNSRAPITDLRQRCEAVRDGLLDPKQL